MIMVVSQTLDQQLEDSAITYTDARDYLRWMPLR